MYIKTDTQRVQRILTATVMAAAIMSALSPAAAVAAVEANPPACRARTSRPTGRRPAGQPRHPGNPGNPGNPDPGGPTTPTTTPARCKPPWAIPARPWTTSCP